MSPDAASAMSASRPSLKPRSPNHERVRARARVSASNRCQRASAQMFIVHERERVRATNRASARARPEMSGKERVSECERERERAERVRGASRANVQRNERAARDPRNRARQTEERAARGSARTREEGRKECAPAKRAIKRCATILSVRARKTR